MYLGISSTEFWSREKYGTCFCRGNFRSQPDAAFVLRERRQSTKNNSFRFSHGLTRSYELPVDEEPVARPGGG
jgi:hypothetical protein